MTRYGYARVSSRKQDVRGQVVQLRAAGVDEVRTEVGSGAGSRPVLDQLLDEFVAGDVLVGTALDRLGRVGRSLIALVDDLTSRPRDSNKKAGARPALDGWCWTGGGHVGERVWPDIAAGSI
jgi:Resolvase, N terminal domain